MDLGFFELGSFDDLEFFFDLSQVGCVQVIEDDVAVKQVLAEEPGLFSLTRTYAEYFAEAGRAHRVAGVQR